MDADNRLRSPTSNQIVNPFLHLSMQVSAKFSAGAYICISHSFLFSASDLLKKYNIHSCSISYQFTKSYVRSNWTNQNSLYWRARLCVTGRIKLLSPFFFNSVLQYGPSRKLPQTPILPVQIKDNPRIGNRQTTQ